MLILIPLNLSTQKIVGNEKLINHLSRTSNDWKYRNGQLSGQATSTNKVNGAHDEANFDLIELVPFQKIN